MASLTLKRAGVVIETYETELEFADLVVATDSPIESGDVIEVRGLVALPYTISTPVWDIVSDGVTVQGMDATAGFYCKDNITAAAYASTINVKASGVTLKNLKILTAFSSDCSTTGYAGKCLEIFNPDTTIENCTFSPNNLVTYSFGEEPDVTTIKTTNDAGLIQVTQKSNATEDVTDVIFYNCTFNKCRIWFNDLEADAVVRVDDCKIVGVNTTLPQFKSLSGDVEGAVKTAMADVTIEDTSVTGVPTSNYKLFIYQSMTGKYTLNNVVVNSGTIDIADIISFGKMTEGFADGTMVVDGNDGLIIINDEGSIRTLSVTSFPEGEVTVDMTDTGSVKEVVRLTTSHLVLSELMDWLAVNTDYKLVAVSTCAGFDELSPLVFVDSGKVLLASRNVSRVELTKDKKCLVIIRTKYPDNFISQGYYQNTYEIISEEYIFKAYVVPVTKTPAVIENKPFGLFIDHETKYFIG